MDHQARLDHASENEPAEIAVANRQPWHAPVIDIVPLKGAEANGNTNGDGNNSFTC